MSTTPSGLSSSFHSSHLQLPIPSSPLAQSPYVLLPWQVLYITHPEVSSMALFKELILADLQSAQNGLVASLDFDSPVAQDPATSKEPIEEAHVTAVSNLADADRRQRSATTRRRGSVDLVSLPRKLELVRAANETVSPKHSLPSSAHPISVEDSMKLEPKSHSPGVVPSSTSGNALLQNTSLLQKMTYATASLQLACGITDSAE